MPIMGDPSWAYSQFWEETHDAIELLADAKAQVVELEEPSPIVNEIILPKLVEALAKVEAASQVISEMIKENNGI